MSKHRYLCDLALACDDNFSVVADAALDVDTSGRIAWFGPAAQAPEAAADTPTSKLDGVVMPGLINAHAHSPMTVMRGAGDGLPLLRWLSEAIFPREAHLVADDVRAGMQLGAAEMLRAGVTTTCEMYAMEDAVVEGCVASGIRLVATAGVISIIDADESGDISARLDAIGEFHSRHHRDDGRVTVAFGPHSLYDLGAQRCGQAAVAARELDALLHIHVAESKGETDEIEAQHGGASCVQILADAGVFEGHALAAHSIWLDDDDLATYAANDVNVAHCPISNMKLGSGICRVTDMVDANITVSLATDGPASNDNLDLWEEVKVAAMLARVASHDPTALTAPAVLTMATRNAAKAVGVEAGELRAGAWADFIRIDTDDAALVPVTQHSELVSHLAWQGSGRRVSDVWVAGNKVVSGGEVLGIDESHVREEVQRRAQRLAQAARA